jgi:predicted DCC family thiol-disulfide oxidoreductase YuxK
MAYQAFSYRQDSAVPPFPDDKPIIVFDGYCALCSGWANLVLRYDRRGAFRLLTAQAPLGQALYAHYGLGGDDYQSNLLLQNGHVFIKSEGSILMACGLGWPWRAAGLLRGVPLAWRDSLYDWIARNRIRWFGARDACYLPGPEHAARFITQDATEATQFAAHENKGLFEELLGSVFDSLPDTVQELHRGSGPGTWSGQAQVERGPGLVARCMAKIVGFPVASEGIAVDVVVERQGGSERWQRRFGTQRFASNLSTGKSASSRMLVESFGPLRFQIELMPANDRLNWVLRGGSLWGIKLPRFLLPRGETYEYEADGRFHFHVELLHPLAGLVVRYRGWLTPT